MIEGDPVTFSGTATDFEDGNLAATLTWTSSLDGTFGSGGSITTSTLSVGMHTITAYVTDSGGLQGSDAITVSVNSEDGDGLGTVDVRVEASTDDAEEKATGSVGVTSSDLELVFGSSDQTVGMRFNAVTIPEGATITSAYLQFTVDEANSGATSLVIEGEAVDNAPTFSASSFNISSRSTTASSVSWSPVPWTTARQTGPDQRTPDLAPVIQEIVNRSGWFSGNSLVIIISGTGERTAESFDGVSSSAPLLHVDYSVGPNTPPTASYTWNATDLTVDFTDMSTDGDGTVTGWSWDFGDGGSSTLQNPQHTYAAGRRLPGDYTVTLSVTDEDGAASATPASQSVSVTVAAEITVSAISPSTVVAGSSSAMTLTGSGFAPGATVILENGTAGPPPETADVVVVNAGVVTVTVTTKKGGPKRDRLWDVRVSNPGGSSAVLEGGLMITP